MVHIISNNIHIYITLRKDNARKFERGEHYMQIHLYEHFNLPGHSGFLNDVSVSSGKWSGPGHFFKVSR